MQSPREGSHLLSISPMPKPQGSKGPLNRGYLYLPHGAKRCSFSEAAREWLEPYFFKHARNWLDYFASRHASPPILLTAVWVAKSFACSTYLVEELSPKLPVPKVDLWKVSSKGDKFNWEGLDDRFGTMFAPMDEGYDNEGKLKSIVEDQCFGVEGCNLRVAVEMTRTSADSQCTFRHSVY